MLFQRHGRETDVHPSGGPAGLVYGFIVVCIGTLAIFTTMGEMASMYVSHFPAYCASFKLIKICSRAPTSGGQYHWVSMLAPPSSQKFISYITGMRLAKLDTVRT